MKSRSALANERNFHVGFHPDEDQNSNRKLRESSPIFKRFASISEISGLLSKETPVLMHTIQHENN
jgi:hypothetical protein